MGNRPNVRSDEHRWLSRRTLLCPFRPRITPKPLPLDRRHHRSCAPLARLFMGK
jgi:hypothetical protein